MSYPIFYHVIRKHQAGDSAFGKGKGPGWPYLLFVLIVVAGIAHLILKGK